MDAFYTHMRTDLANRCQPVESSDRSHATCVATRYEDAIEPVRLGVARAGWI